MRSALYHIWPYLLSGITFTGIFIGGIYNAVGILIIFICHPLLDYFLTKAFGDKKYPKEETTNLSLYLWPLYQTLFIFTSAYYLYDEQNFYYFICGTLSVGIITGGFGITIAHELVHRPTKWQRALGVWVLTTVNFAAFRIEHVHGHHRNVATPNDPATAKKGENIYSFIPKAIIGVFKGAKAYEDKRISRMSPWATRFLHHRIYQYIVISLIQCLLFYEIFQLRGLIFFLLQSFFAISLLEMVDFIEHYGLERKKLKNGQYEAVGPQHSWDTNFFMTNTSLYNLGKHAHHHQSASLSFQYLTSTPGAHNYPFGYSTAVLLALIPPLWRYKVDPLINKI
jgi:alkane 1-monooxygenase